MIPSDRLEDRIRSLSQKLVEADGEQFHLLAAELRTAITEHIERLRTRLLKYPLDDEKRNPGGS